MTKERLSTEEEIYAAALSELDSGTARPGLWAKAFAHTQGDQAKSKALYIQLRVQQIKDEIQQDIKSAHETNVAQRKVEAFSLMVDLLNLQGYRTSKTISGWTVYEREGPPTKIASDEALIEYAKKRIAVPADLLSAYP